MLLKASSVPERYQAMRISPCGTSLVVSNSASVARHEEHALQAADALLDHGVLGVDRPDAVDVERVAVEVGRERADRDRPDALLVLGHLAAGAEVAGDRDLVGLGRVDAEGHLVVGRDLRRFQRVVGRGLSAAAAGLLPGAMSRAPESGGRRWLRIETVGPT